MLKLRNKKVMSILLAFVMVFTLMAPAFAGDTGAITVPKTKTGSDKTIGNLLITESVIGNVYTYFENNNTPLYVTLEFPSGVEFEDPDNASVSVPSRVAGENNALTQSDVEIYERGDTFLTIRVNNASGNANGYAGLIVDFGNSNVNVKSSAAGDLQVNVKAEGTPFESGHYLVARAASGNSLVTASTPETMGHGAKRAAQIKIEENAVGVFDNGDEIRVILPKRVNWEAVQIRTVGLDVAGLTGDNNDQVNMNATSGTYVKNDTLYIEIQNQSTNVAGFITIVPTIDVEEEFGTGDVEVRVRGDNVETTDVVIAQVADFGIEVKTDGDVPTVLAGRNDSEIVDIVIEETVQESLLPNRTITLELPSYAKFIVENYTDNDSGMEFTTRYHDVKEADWDSSVEVSRKMTLTFDATSSNTGSYSDGAAELELKDVEIAIDADAPAGDLVAKIAGTMGITDELVVAEVAPPVTVSSEEVKELKIGVQRQVAGDIVIVEAEDGAIMDDSAYSTMYIEAPRGVSFAKLPKVEVTEGNLEIDSINYYRSNDEILEIEIDSSSSREAATIVLSNVELNVDRTVPVGDVEFKIYGEALNEVSEWNDVVATFVAAKVITPAGGVNAVFSIGSSLYTLNGATFAMDAAPYIKNDRTYVPVRYLAYALGVSEDDIDYESGVVTMTQGNTTVTLTIGSTAIDVNGQVSQMDVAPEITNERTMLPARFVAEAFGAEVGYAAGTVVINK